MVLPLTAPSQDPVYALTLEDLGFEVRVDWPWASVRRACRSGGWKLHLSSIPTQAIQLLERIAPLLTSTAVPFKIACDERALVALDHAMFGAGQIGKFVTIYPASDRQARTLARELLNITKAFDGPSIPTDHCLGGIVYTRFGGFEPIRRQDRLGQELRFIRVNGGRLRQDLHKIPFQAPKDIPWPFPSPPPPATPAPTDLKAGSRRLFGPGFLVLQVLREHPKGSTFLSLDLRERRSIDTKVLKQGWRHCASDPLGRDMRHRLRHQKAVREALPVDFPAPTAGPYFEVGGNGYLALEHVEGKNLEELAFEWLHERSWRRLPRRRRRRLLEILVQLAAAAADLHTSGFIHRDLVASNVMVKSDGSISLLDLELTHHRDDSVAPLALGTPGFMSPQQEAGASPQPADDVYALGCIMVLLLTGFDPRRVLAGDALTRGRRVARLAMGAPEELVELAKLSTTAAVENRLSLDTLRRRLDLCLARSGNQTSVTYERTAGVTKSLRQMEDAAIQGLLHDTKRDPDTGLWLSPNLNLRHGGFSPPMGDPGDEICRSAHRGVAGPLYLLARSARLGRIRPEAQERGRACIEFLLSAGSRKDHNLPGLHFGEAGVAVALAEAAACGWAKLDEVEGAIEERLMGQLDWPDITHGAAGQGSACLACADLLDRADWRRLAHRYAEYLVHTQGDDGAWQMPHGVEGMSGRRLTGFAHGVAGMVHFLMDWATISGDLASEAAWRRGIAWLEDTAQPSDRSGGSLQWPYSDAEDKRWHWWCHGAPGIALTFLRAFEVTGEDTFAVTAARALRSVPARLRAPNLSVCHGLAGLAEIYIEAYRVLNQHRWLLRADGVLDVLSALAQRSDTGTVTWPVQEPGQTTADLMIGVSGIVHLLLRRSDSSHQRLSFPLLPNPPRRHLPL